MTLQDRIIACARSYIGTRFHHQGRLKKTESSRGGIDCLGLLIGAADELDLRSKNGSRLADLDARDYSHHPDTERLRAMLAEHLYEVSGDGCQAADILLLNIDGRPQHMGIISPSPLGGGSGWGHNGSVGTNNAPLLTSPLRGEGLIHAYAPARAVVEHVLDEYWKQKIVGIFQIAPQS